MHICLRNNYCSIHFDVCLDITPPHTQRRTAALVFSTGPLIQRGWLWHFAAQQSSKDPTQRRPENNLKAPEVPSCQV